MQVDKEINDRYSPLVKPDEVVVVLKKAADSNKIDFSVLISETEHEDPKVEVDTKVLMAIAVGMTTIASKQTPVLAKLGMQVLETAKEIVNADDLTDNPVDDQRIDVV